MRELKFRQFINGEFWYWGYGVLPDPKEFVYPRYPSLPSDQYTGLKDSRGIKIYERDIIKWISTGGGYEVVFLEGAFSLKDGMLFNPKRVEIIGNLDETPELLNETKDK